MKSNLKLFVGVVVMLGVWWGLTNLFSHTDCPGYGGHG